MNGKGMRIIDDLIIHPSVCEMYNAIFTTCDMTLQNLVVLVNEGTTWQHIQKGGGYHEEGTHNTAW
jgi:hypothetical protein